ncbi:hypothetical protein [Hydrogenophaga crassostreae]|uniref:hypothetical protein n=1 Tax=Hydrogenophaga crassostreae TaxID=1763535 RepID=UPI0012FBEAE4|nr:hypothetical protein [Hydrogenophaga crassostreae]
MKIAFHLFSICFAIPVLLAGCSTLSGPSEQGTGEESVLDQTVKYFGSTRTVTSVKNIDNGFPYTTYEARNNGKFYHCAIIFNRVKCKQPGE